MGAKITVDSDHDEQGPGGDRGALPLAARPLTTSAWSSTRSPSSTRPWRARTASVIAQLGWPDMRLPLLYSVSWPHRIRMSYEQLDLVKLGSMTFKAPDTQKYPCLDLAYAAGR
ncbi:unnamed protein product [Heterosigma akashiwo]